MPVHIFFLFSSYDSKFEMTLKFILNFERATPRPVMALQKVVIQIKIFSRIVEVVLLLLLLLSLPLLLKF